MKISRIDIPEGSPRVCDYCNDVMVDGKGDVVKKCHLTEYGLMCERCVGKVGSIKTYAAGDSVSKETWYKNASITITGG